MARWNRELRELGYRDPAEAVPLAGTRTGWIDRDAAAELVVSTLGAKRSAWKTADIRGKTEVLLAQTCLIAEPAARTDLAEDVTARAVDRCVTLLNGTPVPEHVRYLSSPQVLEVEADIVTRIARRATQPARKARLGGRGLVRIDPTHATVVGALAGDGPLLVVEGAAGAGKTTALRSAQELLSRPLRVSTFRTSFSAAARTIGVPDLHPHQLRHTAASLAIPSGADVKVVQQMLGHSSATMTLDTYGHLFEDRLDEVGDALDAARAAAQQRRNALRALPRVARARFGPK